MARIRRKLQGAENNVDADISPIGFIPKAEDINREGLDVSEEILNDLLTIDIESWSDDVVSIEEFYNKIGDRLPKELNEELNVLKENLNNYAETSFA